MKRACARASCAVLRGGRRALHAFPLGLLVAAGLVAPRTAPLPSPAVARLEPAAPASAAIATIDALACASPARCFAAGSTVAPGAPGSSTSAVLLGTSDAGHSWSAEPTPPGSSSLAAISCASVAYCTAVGSAAGPDPYSLPAASIVATTSSGTSWVAQPAPPGAPFLSGVSCAGLAPGSSAGTGGVGGTTTGSVGAGCWSSVTFNGVIATTDGGAGWGLQAMPVPGNPVQLRAMSCSTGGACASAGNYYDAADATMVPLLVDNPAAATNGGGWAVRPLPFASGRLDGIDCSSANECVAVGQEPGPPPGAAGSSGQGAGAAQGVIVVSSDVAAGAPAWTMAAPAGVGILESVSCPTASICVAVGGNAPAGSPGGSLGTGVVLVSENGGSTWSSAALPPGVGLLDAVTCPTASSCLAAGKSVASGIVMLSSSDGGGTWSYDQAPESVPVPGAGTPGGAVSGHYLSTIAGSLAAAGPAANVGSATAPQTITDYVRTYVLGCQCEVV